MTEIGNHGESTLGTTREKSWQESQTRPVETGSSCKRVLLVEDDPFQQLRISALLKYISSQYATAIKVQSASTLDEAFEALYDVEDERYFDLVLSDVCLGQGEYSIELSDICRKKYPLTRFVFTSGQLSKGTRYQLKRHIPSTPFLSKTMDPAEYMRALECMLFDSDLGKVNFDRSERRPIPTFLKRLRLTLVVGLIAIAFPDGKIRSDPTFRVNPKLIDSRPSLSLFSVAQSRTQEESPCSENCLMKYFQENPVYPEVF